MSFSFTELILFTEWSNECQQKGNSRDWVSGSRQEENRNEGMPFSASAESLCEGDVRICNCFPKDVLSEAIFAETAGRNLLKDFFCKGTDLIKF